MRETRTNTPLQALTLLNDVTFVEAARLLAQRMVSEGARSAADRLTLGFRLVLARLPTPVELSVLQDGLQAHLGRYRAEPESARQLVALGDIAVDAPELAAYAAIASLLLNLDETITNE